MSPGSTVFPDGLLDSSWFEKHKQQIPSVFVIAYTLLCDAADPSAYDQRVIEDIISVKRSLGQTGYRCRFAVIMVGRGAVTFPPDIESRLVQIRRATTLESKTSLFYLPPSSSSFEVDAFVSAFISTIYPVCIEYYRDLRQRARRKRNRSTIPSPTALPTAGSSKLLATPGWHVRYDIKMGVFLEFMQDVDASLRSYESAYSLILSDDVLGSITHWSPRWNEARILADILSIRILRCLFWSNNFTSATRQWQTHRCRIQDLVDRRGKGSSNYGWQAWESNWATVMADMVGEAMLTTDSKPNMIFMQLTDMNNKPERSQPWEYVHHAGYWLRLALKHCVARRTLANAIPEEDRVRPTTSTTKFGPRAYNYDVYLCPEPYEENPLPGHAGIDHSEMIVALIQRAAGEFQKRGQIRAVHTLLLQAGLERMKQMSWECALAVLRPLWENMTYRREEWWTLVEETAWACR